VPFAPGSALIAANRAIAHALGTGETNSFGSGVAFTGCPNTGFTTNQGRGSANFVAAPAPEPGSHGLIACGLLGRACLRKRK
jgi:hypothetical protein